jgi:hypothetical protein
METASPENLLLILLQLVSMLYREGLLELILQVTMERSMHKVKQFAFKQMDYISFIHQKMKFFSKKSSKMD